MKATIYNGTTTRTFTSADFDALSPQTPYAWVDVVAEGPDDPDVTSLLQHMGLGQAVAAYPTRARTSGMFQAFGDVMVGSTWAAPDSGDIPVLVHCAWTTGSIVTIRQGGDKAISDARSEVESRSKALFAQTSLFPGILLQLILESINRQLTDLQTKIDLLDGQIIVSTDPGQLTILQQARSPLQALGTRLPSYATNLRAALIDPATLPGMDADGAQSLQAYAACVNDVVQRIDSVSGDVRDAIQDYQGQVSAMQGNRINQLTLVSTIFLPITFITGYFGMNFQWLGDSTLSFMSWVVLGVVLPLIAVVASIWLLRRGGFQVGTRHRFHLPRLHR